MLNNCEAKGLGCVLTLPIYRGREQHGNGREEGDKGTGSGRVRYKTAVYFSKQNSTFVAEFNSNLKISGGGALEPPCLSSCYGLED